ncbi:MAG: AgmX/PglI C-terminal domain-containing protein [Nitrospiria bacterium]
MNRLLIESDDREFLAILAGCGVAYSLAIGLLALVPTPTRSTTDVASLPPRIAKLILEAPPAPARLLAPSVPVSIPSPEAPAAKTTSPRTKPAKPKIETPAPPATTPEETPPIDIQAALNEARLRLEAEAAARREQNRAIAKQSGLLKALSGNGGGGGIGQAPALEKVLSDVSVLSNPALTPGGSGRDTAGLGAGATGTGSGESRLSVHDVVSGIKGEGTGEAVILAGKATAQAESSLVVKGASPLRSRDSIQAVAKSLDRWTRFRYNQALAENPLLRGRIAVEFTIHPEGSVTDCRVVSTTLNYPPLEEAIAKRFCALQFPPLPEGSEDMVTVEYPIPFDGTS